MVNKHHRNSSRNFTFKLFQPDEKYNRNRLSLPLFDNQQYIDSSNSVGSKNQSNRRTSLRSCSLSSVHLLLTPTSSLPTKAASLALQELLNCYRTGDMTQEKVSLLLDILDTQERLAKVI